MLRKAINIYKYHKYTDIQLHTVATIHGIIVQ